MTYPSSPDVADLQRKTASLDSAVDELRERQEALTEELFTIAGVQVPELESTLRREIEVLGEELHDDVQTIEDALKTLTGRVAWIERQVRAAGDLTPVDLDTVDATVRRLAVKAERGQDSREALLDEPTQARHRARIDRYATLRSTIADTTAAALQQSRVLADTAIGTAEHRQAGARHHQYLNARDTARAQLAQADLDATASRAALDRDAEQRGVHGPQIMTGEAARATLHSKLRDRIATALADGALMPIWFTTTLGYGPPAERTEQWLSTATSVLAYRITCTVTDQVVALGAPPARGDDSRRAVWYRDLERATRKLRQAP